MRRIDLIFDAERELNGLAADRRLELRRSQIVPLIADLETWMREQRATLSRHNDIAKAMDYMLKRWRLGKPRPIRHPVAPAHGNLVPPLSWPLAR